eukprot:tig00021603_g22828.t1
MEPAISQLVSQGAKLDKALSIYLQLIELAWPEPMIAQACKSLHVAFDAPFSGDPTQMTSWTKEEIKADFEALFSFMSKKYAEIEAAKAAAAAEDEGAEGTEASAEGPAATKAPKFKALGPLQKAKAKADLLPRRPKDIAKEASSHRPDWPAPAPYRYLKLDKRNDTGFTRRRWPEPFASMDFTDCAGIKQEPEDLLSAAAAASAPKQRRRRGPKSLSSEPEILATPAREPETVDLTLEEPARGRRAF